MNGASFPYDFYQGETTANVAEASLLAGVNYFFLPQLSVGLEANFSAGMEFSTSNSTSKTTFNGGLVFTNLTNSNTLIEGSASLWRLLYLSYHFGKTAENPAQK